MALVESHGLSPLLPPVGYLHPAPRVGSPAHTERDDTQAALASETSAAAAEAVLLEWLPVTTRLSIPVEEASAVAERARINRTGFLCELVASGLVREADIFRAVANELALPFIAEIDASALVLRGHHRRAALRSRHGLPLVPMQTGAGNHVYLLARADIDLSEIRRRIARGPGLVSKLFIAPPSAVRAAILLQARRQLLFDAQNELFVRSPELSARLVVNGWQGACVGAFLVGFPVCLIVDPGATMLALHVFAAAAFLSCIALRGAALRGARPPRLRRSKRIDPGEQPVYSVLVALYREREIIPQLLVALGRLQWPRSKLEIKLVCEEDDYETLSALRAHRLRPGIEIVEVPRGVPRTKPKALAYALPLCSGEFVTLYDAEDRPHPSQLVEAWQRFRTEDGDLACLQAPLIVTNNRASRLSCMFAFEYAGLFRGLLPMLARLDVVLPLGGTSNHFRRSALTEVGGWDAYNVTEDADLGVRLKRYGYRTGVMDHPTFEDGPEELKVWLPQRTRWFKGWIQTWLVHMRDPFALWRDLDTASFLVMQILFAGMVASALVHPMFVASVLYGAATLAWTGAIASREAFIAAIGLVNIALGYGVFIALGWITLSPVEKLSLGRIVVLTPLHWLLLSLAAWLAIWELYRRPHHWNKTPHRRARSFARAAAASVAGDQAGVDDGAPMIAGSSSPMASRSRPS